MKVFLFIKYTFSNESITTHIIDISCYTFNKDYIDGRIISDLCHMVKIHLGVKKVKRSYIIKTLDFVEMYIRVDSRFKNRGSTDKVIKYCDNWSKNYIENYGYIFN